MKKWLTSKTLIGALVWVIGFLSQPDVLELLPQGVAGIIQAAGGFLAAVGIRLAVDKAAKGESK